MEWGNLRNWLGSDPRSEERQANRALWNDVDALWRASPFANGFGDHARLIHRAAWALHDPEAASPILFAMGMVAYDLLAVEEVQAIEADWHAIDNDVSVALSVRETLARRRRWAVDTKRQFALFSERLLEAFQGVLAELPESCFQEWPEENERGLEVPLLELLDNPAAAIQALALIAHDPRCRERELFTELRAVTKRNYLIASGYEPEEDPTRRYTIIQPTEQRAMSATALADLYLAGTPMRELLDVPVPFDLPDEARFSHTHILGGTGHGKTQLMQRLIHADLVAAQTERRSVVVIDSQGDLINKLVRLALFDPDTPNSLADRLVLIDPADIEFPAALNLFDAHLDRVEHYRPIDRERVLNGVVELYETFFGDMLGAELTQKQGVIFRYLARLMVTIPGATIHTLMQLMDDGAPFKPYMRKLAGSARYFFEMEFFHPSFAATKKQILRRLWGVLSTPAFERLFAQKENKLDLYRAMNEGKIILVSTAKDLLKEDGSALFGRFFIAMLKQAALERSVLPEDARTPTFVYVDEAQEYFGDDIETILNQARKYRVGLTMAHQTLDQLTPRLRSALHANTSLKCVGGVSAKDARGIAEELHTTPDFIESMKRRGERTEFAVWLKQTTPRAIRLTVPLGFLERQPTLTEEAFDALLAQNQARYCGTLVDVQGFDAPTVEAPEPRRRSETTRAPREAPVEAHDPPVPPIRTAEPQPRPEARPSPPRPPNEPPGKGGPKHRYLQSLVKELGEQQGFKATIEAPIQGGGQIDVLLERDGVRVAVEVSVSTPVEWEVENVRKCLAAAHQVALVLVKSAKTQTRYRAGILDALTPADRARLTILAPEEVPDFIAGLTPTPAPSEGRVKGYKVTVSHEATSQKDAKTRRETLARLVSRSLEGNGP